MASKKKDAATSDAATVAEEPNTLDQFVALRKEITGENGVTRLIDILIGHHGGDAEAVQAEIVASAAAPAPAASAESTSTAPAVVEEPTKVATE